MTTPNIPTWQYRVKVNGTWEGDAMKLEIDDLRSVLQSQAERIKELEREIQNQYKCIRSHAVVTQNAEEERDTLRTQLAEIEKAEPVCLIPDYELDYMRTSACGAVYKIGSDEAWDNDADIKLFTRPMPAQDVTELAKDGERYRWFADIAVNGYFDKAEKAFACFESAESCTKQELDAAIDAALVNAKGAK